MFAKEHVRTGVAGDRPITQAIFPLDHLCADGYPLSAQRRNAFSQALDRALGLHLRIPTSRRAPPVGSGHGACIVLLVHGLTSKACCDPLPVKPLLHRATRTAGTSAHTGLRSARLAVALGSLIRSSTSP